MGEREIRRFGSAMALISALIFLAVVPVYPVPQNAPHVSAGMNVLNFPEGQRPKATDVSQWYGVYP